MTTTTEIKSFEVGATYGTRSACDHDCIFRFTVAKRSAQTVWLNYHGKVKARRVRIVDGQEACDPMGRFSMAPVLFAGRDLNR